MRRKLIVGNWKMHGSLSKNQLLINQLKTNLRELSNVDFAVCIPYPYLFQAQTLLAGSNILWGAQNVSQHALGPYTASVSASMIADFGCEFTIIGHSERRALSHESYSSAADRFGQALIANVTPIFCVGETLEERESGLAKLVVRNQMNAILNGLDKAALAHAIVRNAVFAYEPVWAIGTGKTATPEEVQCMHAYIRTLIAEADPDFAVKARIIYGGSLTPTNAPAIFSMSDIDGGLVGRCSLDPRDFTEIIQIACKKSSTDFHSVS